MNTPQVSIKRSSILVICFALFACSGETDPKAQAQKELEAQAIEIQAKARARIEFKKKYCKDKDHVECQKLMEEAGLIKGKSLY